MVDIMDRPFPPRHVSEDYVTTASSNSRFRNLFSRKKSSPIEDLRSLNVEIISRPTSSATSQRCPLDDTGSASEQMSRKDTIVSRKSQSRSKSRSRRRMPPTTHESTQPLPLAEAYAQASLDSVLQIPIRTFRDWLPLSTSRSTSRRQSEILPDTVGDDNCCRSPSKTATENHTQDVRTSNSCQLNEKLFLLCDHATILQYGIDGESDRLPEKSFKILPESLAYASDAIAGKHWVLDISVSTNTIEDFRGSTSWSNWSKLSFRTAETKKDTETLLIVFDNPELMSTWLAAIRREIDSLGELRYKTHTTQKDSESSTSTLQSSSGERPSLKSSFLRFSRSASNLRNELYNPAGMEKDLPRLPVPSTSSCQKSISGRSVAASSIATTTSLDHLKDVDTGSTTTATTNSLDGSVALESPIKAAFADILSPVPTIETRSSMYTITKSHRRTVSGSSTNKSKPLLQTINSETSLSKLTPQHKIGKSPTRSDVPRPISVLMPLPNANTSKKPSPTQQLFPPEIATQLPPTETKRPMSSCNGHTSKLSVDSQAKSMYSLFPKKLVTEVKTEPLIVLEANHIPGIPSTHTTDYLDVPSPPVIAQNLPPISLSSRAVPVKRPSALKLLTPLEIQQPERSPAVTADMLASNFGTSPLGHHHSPISPSRIQVPSFEDLRIYIGLRERKDLIEESVKSNKPPTDRDFTAIKRQKSTPNLHSTSRAPSAPVGPPPKGPLPAVPITKESTASYLTGPQAKRISVQGNHQKSVRSPSHGASRPQSSYKRQRSKSQAGKNNQVEYLSHNSTTHITPPPPSSLPQYSDDSFGMPSVVYQPSLERSSDHDAD